MSDKKIKSEYSQAELVQIAWMDQRSDLITVAARNGDNFAPRRLGIRRAHVRDHGDAVAHAGRQHGHIGIDGGEVAAAAERFFGVEIRAAMATWEGVTCSTLPLVDRGNTVDVGVVEGTGLVAADVQHAGCPNPDRSAAARSAHHLAAGSGGRHSRWAGRSECAICAVQCSG